ncbi:MAG: glucose 1-dehydrogenase [Verrucomicrobiota bacterium]|nr:glucose 1-dehydrogenase [Verrucomicrobiota bacterium]
MKLAGKTALITGAAQGIGAAIAIRLAREGADIIIDDRSETDSAKATEKAITDLGRKVVFVAEDLSVAQKDAEMIQIAVQKAGQIDILVNNAGVERNASFWDVTEKDFDFVLDVNLKGLFFATQEFVKHRMAVKQPGKIINISSVHEELPFPHFSSYCATKGALKMLTRNLSIELAPYNITINNIAPGAIETPINSKLMNSPDLLKALLGNIPLNRLGKPEDVAGIAAFLASTDADYMTGTTVFVDGGLLWNYSEQ